MQCKAHVKSGVVNAICYQTDAHVVTTSLSIPNRVQMLLGRPYKVLPCLYSLLFVLVTCGVRTTLAQDDAVR